MARPLGNTPRLILTFSVVAKGCISLVKLHVSRDLAIVVEGLTGWPRNRENKENREFGSYFFQTGKTQGILLQHREKFWDTGKIFLTVFITAKSMFPFTYFLFFLASLRSAYFLVSDHCFWYFFYQYTSIFTVLFSFHITLVTKYQPHFFWAVLKTNVISNVYIQ